MNFSYDLHIHSCLSPCGDNDMTPGNIAGMAALKGLDIVALTDHNTARNCPAFLRCAEKAGILGIPGMELTTAEEIHAVCLFRTLEAALDFDAYVYERLMKIRNREDIFGQQLILNENDEITGSEPMLLINATSISFDELWEPVTSRGGVMFPAHIDKTADSLLAVYGFIPHESRFCTAELKNISSLHQIKNENPYLNGCRIISNSDAHYLGDINEPELTLDLPEKSADALIDALLTKLPS